MEVLWPAAVSAEGTTQGDPLSMGVCALSIQPLITALQTTSSTKQCWFADNASGAGPLSEIKKWWDTLTAVGPDSGYFPNAKKCWIIVKPEKKHWFLGTTSSVFFDIRVCHPNAESYKQLEPKQIYRLRERKEALLLETCSRH